MAGESNRGQGPPTPTTAAPPVGARPARDSRAGPAPTPVLAWNRMSFPRRANNRSRLSAVGRATGVSGVAGESNRGQGPPTPTTAAPPVGARPARDSRAGPAPTPVLAWNRMSFPRRANNRSRLSAVGRAAGVSGVAGESNRGQSPLLRPCFPVSVGADSVRDSADSATETSEHPERYAALTSHENAVSPSGSGVFSWVHSARLRGTPSARPARRCAAPPGRRRFHPRSCCACR
ncbi:hypothetical protein SAMN05216189_100753 [Pseudomonas delhiensis]|uniref:Uncharacterized protein n=1 Tax=Pseudomonas delhiensis TaxID=366289 RepID=A0A1G8M3W4_9PSED|nr:hypothetical protein SAMN05216189_100753 [Pseudomonas delhiensis]